MANMVPDDKKQQPLNNRGDGDQDPITTGEDLEVGGENKDNVDDDSDGVLDSSSRRKDTFANGTTNGTTNGTPASARVRSPQQMLKSQIQLLERQLMETRRMLHRQEQQGEPLLVEPSDGVANATANDNATTAFTSTPLHSNLNGKAYYGALHFDNDHDHGPLLQENNHNHYSSDSGYPTEVPSEIRMTRNPSEAAQSTDTLNSLTNRSPNANGNGNGRQYPHHYPYHSAAGGSAGASRSHSHDHTAQSTVTEALHHIFDDAVATVRSEDDFEKEEVNHESEIYLHSSILERAFPERQFALFVTLLFELPVLFMISGGSDKLCSLVGRSKYQLLMAFLPLTSAISGNVGLQASTLTTRAISHNHVTSHSYMPWFLTEVGAAFCLAMGMGCLLGSLALYASGWDLAFALTIFVAQVISIVTAGCTGTFAPLLFSFIFRRDSGKWGGPLETAVQDIVGSFAMVVISYKILQLLGPLEIDPSDLCGGMS